MASGMACVAAFGAASHAVAQTEPLCPQLASPATPSSGLQWQSDRDLNSGVGGLTLEGHVRLDYQNFAICADRVEFDRRAMTLLAVGNASVRDPDGNLSQAERINLPSHLVQAFYVRSEAGK